ncbi:kinase RLK-Pelle-WAK family protein [Tanacetum coccineum]
MSNHEQPTPSHPKSDVRNTTGKNKQILQDSVRTTSAVDLEEFCEKHYEKLLPIMADKYEYEKRKKEKLEEVKARLDFGDARKKSTRAQESAYSESRTVSPRRRRRSRSPRHNPSVFTRLRRERSRSPRHEYKNKERRESTVFKRLGSRGRSTSAHSDSRQESSRYMENYSESEDSEGGHWKSKLRRKKSSVEDDDLSQPWVCAETDPFTSRIRHFDFPKTRMPSHVKTYNGSEDPEDHLKIFQAAAKTESYNDLREAFLKNYFQQKKCIRDPIVLHNIKQRDGESTEDFIQRYKSESGNVKGAPECMRISGFVHGITNPELIKRFHEKIPKTVDEMMQVATSFLQGQEAASNQERKKVPQAWRHQEGSHRQNFKKGGGFRSQHKTEKRPDRFTLLTKTPKEILALEKGKFKTPPPMTTPVEKRNANKFCEFHGEVGHNTDECNHLRKQIEDMLKAGKLSHIIRELKQNSGKEQPKKKVSVHIFKSQNKFVAQGCGHAVMMDNNDSVLTGCSNTCSNDTIDRNKCFGISCCETTIPHYLKSYSMNLTGLKSLGGDALCGFAHLVADKNSYVEGISSSNYVKTSLLWTLTDHDSHQINCSHITETRELSLDLGNGNSISSWKCYPSFRHLRMLGSPYLEDGLEVLYGYMEEGPRCESNGSCHYCWYYPIYNGDGLPIKWKLTCDYNWHNSNYSNETKSSLDVILGVSISMGVLFLAALTYILYKLIKKTKERRRRKRFFKRNGGLLLKQQEETDPSLVDQTILFTSRQLEKATDNFNENRVLGRGGQGTVYKGMLVDGRIVAVKKSKIVDESQLEQFINEVVILSQVNHRNVVKLLGCCLETDVPLLVSEFIPNGTLYDRIHCETDEDPMSLNMRLQIATEVAGALAYLHSATSIPVYHRDIKTTNILLDDKYRAKVSDFGTSKFVSIDQTHLTTLVKGTFGYLDPEYFQSSQFTEKSDVYSFGVVLVELLTGERPISLTRFGENRSLAAHFMLAMEEGRVMSIFDAMVIREGTSDELLAIANLAMRCLNFNGKNRPTMKEVAVELETVRTSHIPSAVETNTKAVTYGHELSMLSYGESTSTFLSSDENITQ